MSSIFPHGTQSLIDQALESFEPSLRIAETGVVTRVDGDVARVRGLPGLGSEELVEFDGGARGIAIDLQADEVGVVLVDAGDGLRAGTRARSGGRQLEVPVGERLLGRVIDPTGRPLDGRGPLHADDRRPVEAAPPAIMDRAPVTEPLQTGLKVVDALIPIGRGQRELIVGDRQSGKTTIAVDTILNQRGSGVACVYCAIGQRGTAVASVIESLRAGGALDYTVVVVAAGEDPVGLQYVAPYAATTIAERFMRAGRDALIVYDDLTRHARAYRELSLLLRRPPGREAYPGDVFYLHARLLERATRLRDELGGGSLTALPVVETQAQDIAAYIPTNLISITDGQVYVSPDLFHKGILPPVDVGRSVSRVGGKTQLAAYRAVAGPLRLAHAQFEELEAFSRFATRLDEQTRARIERGRRVREALKQGRHSPLTPAEQVAVLHAAGQGIFDDCPLSEIPAIERAICAGLAEACGDLCARIERGEKLDASDWQRLEALARDAVATRMARSGAARG
ncbi:alternate F1F0 ATPase, F1 subunit alpha [Burkholderiaceae bacterium FT117]|uniref:alternate F1F0 ATPase, F1 subunit alpha n=1 Tax=Zeimonas sediminis TaxID=2944268 RepID=UPI002342F015|nr:alternate F1F0 ATPase, F1 subunit alpha [Zeimonas sediminis]MCM5571973.1 alternate F1F0 ATPase, F1 subunit alpha [Zeimonas sediminis]